MTDERTKDGQEIIRSVREEHGWRMPEPDGEIRQAVEAHLQKFLGANAMVWHEIVSDLVHIDVYKFSPTPDRPFYTLVTLGMSDLPMTVPTGLENMARAELMLCLPPEWPLDSAMEITSQGDLADFNNFWPIHTLKYLARMPHEFQTWLGWGHSISNGNPPENIANTNFTGNIIGPTVTLPDEFVQLKVGDREVWFYGVFPVYSEEMSFKTDHPDGADALFKRFEAAGIVELVDIARQNVCSSRSLGTLFSKSFPN